MLDRLRNAWSILPKSWPNLLVFNTLVGLHADQTINSITLLHQEPSKYLKNGKMMREHCRYPEIYIRRTKKAYVSIVSESICVVAKEADYQLGYSGLLLSVKRRGLEMNM